MSRRSVELVGWPERIIWPRQTDFGGTRANAEGSTDKPTAVALDDATVAFRLAEGCLHRGRKGPAQVAHGEFVAIVGPTGCGKSTLLNVAAGLLKPAGRIGARFSAIRLTGLNREAGYLFQADALFPWKTAIDNVAIGLEIKGAPRAQALERAQGWLTAVGLGAFGGRYPHMLSGGQRKRVGLAQVLIRDPKILLMDEPFGPLDAQTRQIMGNLLLELWNADRKAVLFVTHDLEEAIALADRVVIMSAGRARASSATGGCRCRARATFPRSAWKRIFTACTGRYGAFSRMRC